ncbi:MAG: immunoglobulin domain-containing protein [Bacteroidota bacterium]
MTLRRHILAAFAVVVSLGAMEKAIGQVVSDDFSASTLNTSLWTFINPGAPSTLTLVGNGTSDAQLQIAVPAGTAHDAWSGSNGTARIMQPTSNTDFEVEAKFESVLNSRFQIQGIIVEQNTTNYLRFDVYRTATDTRIHSASIVNGTPTVRHNAAIPNGTPIYLRLRRLGNQWTQSYSFDGTTWLAGASYSHTLNVTAVGPFAGNAGSPVPAFTSVVDYFFNTASRITPEDPLPAAPWWNNAWRFRVSTEINANGFTRSNKPAEVELNFTQLLSSLGQSGTFAENSIRVIEVSNTGAILDPAVPFQFDKDATYNAVTNAKGTLAFLLNGSTPSNGKRYYHFYFETTAGGSFTLPSFTSQLVVTDDVAHEGQPSVKIETPRGIYYYQKLGGGFASIEDTQGNDWVGYTPGGGSAGEFRGVPNLGDVFHPGYVNSTSSIESQGPLKTRIRTTSLDNGWECVWDIYPEYARMTLLKRNANYWFLYEGTPGGTLNTATDFVVRPTGQRTPLSTSWFGDLTSEEWAYFGDAAMQRVFYVAHHEEDTQPDYFRHMDGNMTVFGFGRQDPCCTRYLTAIPQTFTIGFAPDSTFGPATQTIRAAYKDLQITSGAPETNLSTPVPPFITLHPLSQTVTAGQSAVFLVAATGTEPVSYQWQRNGVNIPGAINTSHTTASTIVADNGTNYRCIVSNSAGSVSSNLATLTVNPAPGVPVSDDFNTLSLNTNLWTFVNPLGDAGLVLTGAGTTNARLQISVPAGTVHDLWSTNKNAPRLMQTVANGDFEVEVKFEAQMNAQYQAQGILIQQDVNNFIRFDFVRNSNKTRLFSASIANNTATTRKDTTIIHATTLYLRVKRIGNQWTQSFSYNGTTWITGAVFNHTLNVSALGPFVGNAGSTPPAFTALIDYFFNTSAPIVAEDGSAPADPSPPVISNVQSAPAQLGLTISWNTDEPATGRVDYGLTPVFELGSVSHSNRSLAHSLLFQGLQQNTLYYYRIISADSTGNVRTSDAFTATTLTATIPIIELWYGNVQSFGHIGNPVPDINILGNVTDPDGLVSLKYSLNGGLQKDLTIGPDTRRLTHDGDFNADIPYGSLVSGANQIIITALDSFNTTGRETVIVNYTPGQSWPQAYNINWNTAARIQDVAQVVDGLWTMQGNYVKPVQPGYDRLIGIGEQHWENYEVTMPVTVLSIDSSGFGPPSNGAGIGFILRWPGHSNSPIAGKQPKTGYLPLGALGWYSWRNNGDHRLTMLGNNLITRDQDSSGKVLTLNVPHMMKMRVETVPGIGGRYSMKFWPQAQSEPATWDITGQETLTDPQTGSILLIAHHVDVLIGNISVTPVGDTTHTLNITTVGSGSVLRTPNQVTYATGQVVTLTAQPISGWLFDIWSGDVTGNTNPTTISMNGNRSVTATFIGENVPPVISNITRSVTSGHATVRWTTNEPATSSVSYGPTAAYENGTVSNPALVTQHETVLTGLSPGSLYHFRISSSDGNNNTSQSGDSIFTTSLPSNIISDDFNAFGLSGAWSFVNPRGDALYTLSGTNTQDAAVTISVPGGITHDVFTGGVFAPRVVQNTNNADFEVEFKYLTGVNQRFQLQGLVVQQDNDDFLRFEFHSDGTSTRILGASFAGVTSNIRLNTSVAPNLTTPLYMRVKREGDTWTQAYSLNGSTWISGTIFSHAMNVSSVALYSGNAGPTPPAHTASFDYFFNTASPIVPEDGNSTIDTLPPVISNVQVARDSASGQITWITDEPATGIVQYGLTAALELGNVNNPARTLQHSLNVGGLTPTTTYFYRVSSSDSSNNTSQTSIGTFTTKSGASNLVSDDFNADTLNTSLWQFINPLGDGTLSITGTGTVNAWLSMSVPAGVDHNVWVNGNLSPRIMQPASDTDFEVEVKYETGVSQRFQMLGVAVEQDTNDFIRFEFHSDGTTTRLFVASLINGAPTIRVNSSIAPNGTFPLYMRVRRADDSLRVFYSLNGTTWTSGASFIHPLSVTKVGAFVGNTGTAIPAHAGSLDYFFNTTSPKIPEDAGIAIPVSIVQQPVDQIVAPGQRGTFMVRATGIPVPSFQWQKNGININGATDSNYTTAIATLGDSGAVFTCRVTNILGAVTSSLARLHVHTPPSIITHPVGLAIAPGQTATYTVAAAGSTPLSYQWQKNGVDISGATAASYTTPPVTMADSGSAFRCIVSNTVGTATSNPAALLVKLAPSIAIHPVDRFAADGETALFSVFATGATPLSYQWQKNNTDIPGANSPNYTTPYNSLSDSGSAFRCVVTNPVGSATSNAAILHVQTVPVIVQAPVNDSVAAGQIATFTVVASGSAPLAYQWQRNSLNIDGATNPTYATPPVTAADSGATYRCKVTNAVGNVVSSNALLLVLIPPTVTTQPANKLVALGQTARFQIGISGTFPFTFQWQKNGVDIPGATLLAYTTPPTTVADSGTQFRCRVRNSVGETFSNVAYLDVSSPPTIVTQPINRSVAAGQTATFSIVATGTAPLAYQWTKNGVNISGATSTTYTTPAATISDNGALFRCKVSNWVKLVTSDSAKLTVTGPSRVTANLQVLYTFEEGSGTTINDVSGVGTPLNLTVGSAGAVAWSAGKLTVNTSTTLLTPGAATKLITACQASSQITIEAWIKPTNITQTGPAHIVALASGNSNRNVVMGQSATRYETFLRTSSTGNTGTTQQAPLNSATTLLTHVVYTRDASGNVRTYVNGTQVATGTLSGTFSTWNTTYRLGLANEPGGSRTWLGEYHLVAAYSRALTQAEVTQNFSAGANGSSPLPSMAGGSDEMTNDRLQNGLPMEFALHQNFPNPFNPTTTIRYDLPEAGQVSIVLYNVLGQEVRTIVEGYHNGGFHQVRIDGHDLASGVYVYRIQAGEYVSTKKLMLLK